MPRGRPDNGTLKRGTGVEPDAVLRAEPGDGVAKEVDDALVTDGHPGDDVVQAPGEVVGEVFRLVARHGVTMRPP